MFVFVFGLSVLSRVEFYDKIELRMGIIQKQGIYLSLMLLCYFK